MSSIPGPFPSLSLEVTAFTRAQLHCPEAAQAALAGRSNVGKSSLINALAGRKALAKVSAAPGKTRSINYYRLGKEEAFLVDLPGYGYARCSQAERAKWAALLEHYLRSTPGLRALVLLLDARLTPQKSDLELLSYAAALGLPLHPVLTKADKCSKRELQTCLNAWSAFVPQESLLASSARNGQG
ncbi:ribosome biogenesis GTP-binding protein YihA/YsxC, partial [Desulfovibrio sp. OttesenSCG-928-A18]|nr:ribosome biogenesis GTP-binding protein YihA/YsxC [Desulfovibrio sp. OttesenSCG-928-A18]